MDGKIRVNAHNVENDNLCDPEPITLILSLFAIAVGAASLSINYLNYSRNRKQDKSTVIKNLHIADRSLNRIEEAYRGLISIFDQYNILELDFAPLKQPLIADENEFKRIRDNIFYGGRDLQDSISNLIGIGSFEKHYIEKSIDLSNKLDELFHKALSSKKIFNILINLGLIIKLVGDFLYMVGEDYNFKPTSLRLEWVDNLIKKLELMFM